jgi:tRNA threonylcarbamoyladenosine biosynthesis protein TsaB
MPARSAPGADRRAPVVLAFDTAASACSVAVSCGAALLAHERREMRHGHAEALLPMIDRVVAAAGLAPDDVVVVAVSVGPGGFTGIRAGLAAAQGLALAGGARLVGVTSLATVAALVPNAGTNLLVALDSRREDFYVQLFDADRLPLGEAATVLPEALGRFVAAANGAAPLRVAGDAAEQAAATLAACNIVHRSAPDARGVLAAALGCLDSNETPARALYLRRADVSFPKTRRRIDGAS